MIQKERIVTTRANQDIERLINKLTKGNSIKVKNWEEVRDFDAQNSTLQEMSYVLATLINELKQRGIL